MAWGKRKDLLGIEDLSREEIEAVLDTAESFKDVSRREIKKVPALRGVTVVNLFLEPSTRTRTSFELAGKRLSADVINISASDSSMLKGESLKDTSCNIEAMNTDILVVRHSKAGAAHFLSRVLKCSVVNAGDGAHEHPTQALLDLFSIREKTKRIEGLTVAIIGDIAHSRVARSNILALNKMGAHVRIAGPATMIPLGVETLGVDVTYQIDEAIEGADVVMMLRIQQERQGRNLFPSIREYARFFGLNLARLKGAKKDVLIMHPGPINRGVEIAPDVADGPYSIILNQVTNGVAVRMAILFLYSGAAR
ncbi:MAG: aspartate carbamoyltransferase [Nitrospirae bacterium CG_4_9_14_3_um_filter_53_35]|nr:MAG: aspartate carbamoyltransferase [Nitrospirae bacterium CG2_30_53_67]PIS35932.1 MAG: aspartate carbamoyltransferase [Nitrospirae bacterium CG08_land_8_20_14_0_20_52_24]PIV84774.1 MAG: aspartate carbamoyltransferase [Nitrospirae bacterium CG17_big_fil_post_rev_8_21_14_2_50_50_9]PIW85098.1 MAG: aspartate carbamoyltransferase [Nitrospirae bacterium CG_4_8_14_3_um_filter_50_41]PIX84564.1 MAG: aspartate carbamoyltransferase [Nitrospirae bacterium CG_4_10_14_3_um_filter_53_41]PJA72801.1 MAG: a